MSAPAKRALGKAHTAAVVVSPPEELWGPVQALRARYDRAFERWMPHVNLLYPFVREEEVRGVPERLARALAGVGPFRVTLGPAGSFRHKGSATVWLQPRDEPAGALQRLHAALLAELPECGDTARRGGFTPHLTVAKCSHQEVPRIEAEAAEAAAVADLSFEVTHVDVIYRGAHTPFAVRYRVPLGSGDSPPDFVPRLSGAPYDSSRWAAPPPAEGE